ALPNKNTTSDSLRVRISAYYQPIENFDKNGTSACSIVKTERVSIERVMLLYNGVGVKRAVHRTSRQSTAFVAKIYKHPNCHLVNMDRAGDSGGPLMTRGTSGEWTLVGVVSWGNETRFRSSPFVFSDVSALLSWIQDVVSLPA
ncbi:chymotrypsin, putative, partial [Ixodes scapularis]